MSYLRILIILFFVQVSYAQEVSLQFEQANQVYRNGDVQKAAGMYEEILKNGYESPALYYNLGNAHFKLNNIPSAILNYERAKRLAPHDDDVSYNLRLANLRVIDKIEPIPQLFFTEWWQSIMNLYSADGWSIVMIIALWCAAISFAILLMMRSMLIRKTSLILTAAAVVISVLSIVALRQREHQEQAQLNAIITAASVSVKSAPDEQSTDLFILHEGVKVELVDNVGNWLKIHLPDGKVGWLASASLEAI